MKETVVVGMSGGVDSSVCAFLLKEQGYNVVGVTMQIWQDEDEYNRSLEGGCGSIAAIEDAKRVAETIGIPHYVMNFRNTFKEKVMDYFANEYLNARTPNPCLVCNRYVKWEALLERAKEIGADYVATGHYARIDKLSNGRYAIANSITAAKDQTYALYNLTQEQLKHTLMPVGAFEKSDIRKMAADAGLPVASKADSQDICFVPDKDYAKFVEEYTGKKSVPGNFVTESGEVLGQHKGLIHYTIGQRRGLSLPMGRRVFVSELRPETNEVVISEGTDVFSRIVKAKNVNFMGIDGFKEGEVYMGKIRYGHRGTPCTAVMTGEDEMTVTFNDDVRAVTKGQAVVLYKDNYVAAGGTII